MASPADRRARLLASLYAPTAFGEWADWTAAGGGSPARLLVRRKEEDETADFGEGRVIVSTRILRVRRSDLAAPTRGALVTINPDTDPQAMKIIANPTRGPYGDEWVCEFAPV